MGARRCDVAAAHGGFVDGVAPREGARAPCGRELPSARQMRLLRGCGGVDRM